jgi:hypothetical protein
MREESDRLHRLIFESLRLVEDNELVSADLTRALQRAQALREELAVLTEEGKL